MPISRASPVRRALGLSRAPQPADDHEKKMHVTSTPTQGGFLLLRTIPHPSQSPGADSGVVADTLLIFILPKFFVTATSVYRPQPKDVGRVFAENAFCRDIFGLRRLESLSGMVRKR